VALSEYTIMDPNKEAFEREDIVKLYRNAFYLDKAELVLLCKLEDKLKSMKMLDIGVGGGRTTYFFASRVAGYTGIDYSENMIKASKERFPKERFLVCDVRNMDIFDDGSFDLVLFSFNGPDYLSHEDRLKALKEIKRVCRQGGMFFFSTHNLTHIDEIFRFKWSISLIFTLLNIRKYILLRMKNNKKRFMNMKYAIVIDGTHNFKIASYYILPDEQVNQLSDLGFKDIKIFSSLHGLEMENNFDDTKEPWLHYLCTK
jgi:ubiquinone/menaquinone biosynthesis C-methylase UbiE